MRESQSNTKQLFAEIERSKANGKKRDFVSEFRELAERAGIRYRFEFEEENLPDMPTVVVSNHFIRHWWDKRSLHLGRTFGKTWDSMIVAGVISTGAAEGPTKGKGTSWLIKDKIRTHIGPIPLKEKQMQSTFIEVYDHIPVSVPKKEEGITPGIVAGVQFARTLTYIRNHLARGKNIGLYAEGDNPGQMKMDSAPLATLLKSFRKRKIGNLQVIPASVCWENGEFKVHYSKAIQAGEDYKTDAQSVIQAIAAKLPPSLKV